MAREMPKGWKSPLREPLYRVVVDQRGERLPVVVSPAMLWSYAEMFAITIRNQINAGRENNWSNPTVIPAEG